jgi:hypothetical protein
MAASCVVAGLVSLPALARRHGAAADIGAIPIVAWFGSSMAETRVSLRPEQGPLVVPPPIRSRSAPSLDWTYP